MFQSFTGNSRRPRQVNLSGRKADPFASTQSTQSGKPPGGSSNALVNAQLERKARQQEREKLNASKTIQRVWRGHRHRKDIRSRQEQLLGEGELYLRPKSSGDRNLLEIQQYLRLYVHTARPALGDGEALRRLLQVGQWIYEKATDIATLLATGRDGTSWAALLRALIKRIIGFLNSVFLPIEAERLRRSQDSAYHLSTSQLKGLFGDLEAQNPSLKDQVNLVFILLGSNITLLDCSPSVNWQNIRATSQQLGVPKVLRDIRVLERYYTFAALLTQLDLLPEDFNAQQRLWHELAGHEMTKSNYFNSLTCLIAAPVFSIKSKERQCNQAKYVHSEIILRLLTAPSLSVRTLIATDIATESEILYQEARRLVYSSSSQFRASDYRSILANIVHMSSLHQTSDKGQKLTKSARYTDFNLLSFVSSVLELFTSADDLDNYSQTQLQDLTSADAIRELFGHTDPLKSSIDGIQGAEVDVLSDFILNILRLLPQQADEVRYRLYTSHKYQSSNSQKAQKPAVRYFWDAVTDTGVFKRAVRGWSEVKALLSDASSRRRPEWKVIVLFIEIYTFALRFQDDDHFVNGLKVDEQSLFTYSSTLAHIEVQMLVEFLKNISFCLYLKMPLGALDHTGLESFGTGAAQNDAGSDNRQRANISTSFARGINLQQLKESATGLLRMLYERDSRRNFLPRNSFLMLVDEIDSRSFNDSVIKETILRQKLDDEDSEEEDEVEDYEADANPHGDPRFREANVVRFGQASSSFSQQRRLARIRARQEAAPRVQLLENIPFLVPFETRVQLFRMNVENDMIERRGGDSDAEHWIMMQHMSQDAMAHSRLAAHKAELHRESIFEDAFNAFDELGEGLKEPIRISFAGEEGIDGGGVTKEFLTSVIGDVFRVNSPYHLFAENDDHMLYPNPNSLEEADAELDEIAAGGILVTAQERIERRRQILKYYRFAGRLVGKCLYEGILVDIPVARFFVTKWALTGGDGAARNETTYRPDVNDMWDYDKAIYRGLLNVQKSKEDVSTWGMTFAVDGYVGGKQVERELKPGGADIMVNNNNRLEYVSRMVGYYLNTRQGPQTRAFLAGLSSIIKPTWLRMFNEGEIRVLLGGESRPIDVEDLRRNTHYSGVYVIGDDGQEHATIQMFWEVMHEMEDADRRKLLQYVTSTPNAPLMGFAHLNPRFSIRDSLHDQGRLPTSSTCANLLKLPIYRSKKTLRDRIMTAIHSGAGFDLS